jgi:hypothetical protein
MKVLVATHSFSHVGGTETYVLTVAEQLQRLGHQVGIYARHHGDMAGLARERAVDVVVDPDELGAPADVLLTQDAGMAYELADRYPLVPQVFVNHSAIFDPQQPPLVPGVVEAVVVMSERFGSRVAALDTQVRMVRLTQPIDTERLIPRRPPSDVPRRALLLGNYLAGDALRLLVETWSEMGLEVVQVGSATTPTLQPEVDIAESDIVVGKGRAVLDAMACGRPAYLYDAFGGDGWVTPETYAAMESDAFAGQALTDLVDGERLRKDLAQYDPAMGTVNRTLVLKHHQARKHVQDLVGLFEEVSPRTDPAPVTEARELARQVRLRWRSEMELMGLRAAFEQHVQRAGVEVFEAQQETREVRAEGDGLREQLRVSWEDRVRLDAAVVVERAERERMTRRRDQARARGRAFKARYDELASSRWVRLGRALGLVPRAPERER